MADNTATINFNNDVISDGQGNTAVVTGKAVVDYTNNGISYSVKITFPDNGYVTIQDYVPEGSNFSKGNGNYMVGSDSDTFSFSWTGNVPSQATEIAYRGATPAYTANGASLSSMPGGTVEPLPPVCFATGTRIETARGAVPVEALQAGDEVVTASGELRRIVWVGHKHVDCAAHPTPAAVWPVRIRAGAFGIGDEGLVPKRDLFLSPGHPVRVGADDDAHLVPIMCLVNGTTIERMPVDGIDYWHVELEAHDLLLAEGLAAESYLDWGDRPWFSNAVDHALANPDFVVPGLAGRCLPVALDGPVVDAERRRLDAVFAMDLSLACDWPGTEAAADIL